MKQPIDVEAKTCFLAWKPLQALRTVLQQAHIQNSYYEELFDKGTIKLN